MVYRASLAEDNEEFMPLHRPYRYRRHERLLVKYVDKMLWFKKDKLGDPHKNDWRKNIKFKWSRRMARDKAARWKRSLRVKVNEKLNNNRTTKSNKDNSSTQLDKTGVTAILIISHFKMCVLDAAIFLLSSIRP